MSPGEAHAPAAPVDPRAARRAADVGGLLGRFNEVGVLLAADVRVAERLGRLAGERGEAVLLAAALAVRATRLGSVFVDLATASQTVSIDPEEPVELEDLPWPEPEKWVAAVRSSQLVALSTDGPAVVRPLRLHAGRLYLERYWRDEGVLADDLLALDVSLAGEVDHALLAEGVRRLFPAEEDERQRLAAATAVERRLTVIGGGPGTGKTTTVARVVALLAEQAAAAGHPPPLVGLAAPTGKAAARLQEAVQEESPTLPVAPAVRELLAGLCASTLHRLLGRRPGSTTRFRHHRGNRLPHDVIVIDETSMVPLPMMARVLEAVRPDARVVLVGDPGQLTSVEAGAVLGDVVGPAADGARTDADGGRASTTGFGRGIVMLERVHRFGDGIGLVADAVRRGDGSELLSVLRARRDDVLWLPLDAGEASDGELSPVRGRCLAVGRTLLSTASDGHGELALAALRSHMVLCAHRRGPHGVTGATARILSWFAAGVADLDVESPWFAGQPLLVTENDYDLGLYNGDVGVVVRDHEGHLSAVFERASGPLRFTPARLTAVQTLYAMTIHKSQGSQFGAVTVLLPPAGSRILTRELLYTALTRAMEQLIVVGTEEMLLAALAQPMARTSGLRERLWG